MIAELATPLAQQPRGRRRELVAVRVAGQADRGVTEVAFETTAIGTPAASIKDAWP
jgi:hypothetical protein